MDVLLNSTQLGSIMDGVDQYMRVKGTTRCDEPSAFNIYREGEHKAWSIVQY